MRKIKFSTPVVSYGLSNTIQSTALLLWESLSLFATPLEHHLALDRKNVGKHGVGFLEAVTVFV